MERAYLILEDGSVFPGWSFGAAGTRVGELVFTTSMTGTSESLTDPSYDGQIVLYTFPQLGNYGICGADRESGKIHARGVVVREVCPEPSNFRCETTVDAFLKENGVPGICGVDTRALTQRIRDGGVLNAAIADTPSYPPEQLRAYRVTGSVERTSVREPVLVPAEGEERFRVAFIDYGAKKSMVHSLTKRGCRVTVCPYDTAADALLAAGYDGVMLSNGPGDPADNTLCIGEIRKLLGRIPLFGICLGHQMMALAAGARTEKMKFGHRGANQPVKDLVTGRVYITSQNHGYAVSSASLAPIGAVQRYINVNDGTCEGVDYPGEQAFSMQFHPEAHCGPLDCEAAFDRFLARMGGERNA